MKAKEQHIKQKGQSMIDNPEVQVTLSTQHTERTTMKAKEQHIKQKGQSIINNPEIQATLSTQHTEGRQ